MPRRYRYIEKMRPDESGGAGNEQFHEEQAESMESLLFHHLGFEQAGGHWLSCSLLEA